MLLFNYDIANLRPITDQWKNTLTGLKHGYVDVGTVTASSINYVTKYMFKDWGKNDKRVRPFSLMSKGRRFKKDGSPNEWSILGNYYIKNYGKQ